MTYNLIDDLGELTTIPVMHLHALFDKVSLLICHRVEECAMSGETSAEIDVGIGILYIRFDDEQVKYKFVPTIRFNSEVTETIVSGESPLVQKVEALLKDRICNTYKDLFNHE